MIMATLDRNVVRDTISAFLDEEDIDSTEFRYFLVCSGPTQGVHIVTYYENEADMEKWQGLGEEWDPGDVLYCQLGLPWYYWDDGWKPVD